MNEIFDNCSQLIVEKNENIHPRPHMNPVGHPWEEYEKPCEGLVNS